MKDTCSCSVVFGCLALIAAWVSQVFGWGIVDLRLPSVSKSLFGSSGLLPYIVFRYLKAVILFHFAVSSHVLLPSPVTLSVLSFSAC